MHSPGGAATLPVSSCPILLRDRQLFCGSQNQIYRGMLVRMRCMKRKKAVAIIASYRQRRKFLTQGRFVNTESTHDGSVKSHWRILRKVKGLQPRKLFDEACEESQFRCNRE